MSDKKIHVDIVILSYAKNKEFENITRTGIDSLLKSESKRFFNILSIIISDNFELVFKVFFTY